MLRMAPPALRPHALAAIALALVAAPAAAKASEVEELFLQAVQAHKDGETKEAVKLLKQAAEADDDPTLLYNVAVLADRAGDAKTAGTFYRRYLETDPSDAVVVKLRFLQLAPAAYEAWAKAEEGDAAPVVKGETEDAVVTTQGEGDVENKKVAANDTRSAGTSPLVSYGLIGGGALALAVGATFGALTVSDVNEFMNAKVRSEAQQHADNARSHQLLANVGYLAGLAALGGGVAMLLLQAPGPAAQAAGGPRLTPLLTPASAGASVAVGF